MLLMLVVKVYWCAPCKVVDADYADVGLSSFDGDDDGVDDAVTVLLTDRSLSWWGWCSLCSPCLWCLPCLDCSLHQHRVVWCGAVWYRVVSYGIILYHMVSYGIVGYRMVSNGIAFYRR